MLPTGDFSSQSLVRNAVSRAEPPEAVWDRAQESAFSHAPAPGLLPWRGGFVIQVPRVQTLAASLRGRAGL